MRSGAGFCGLGKCAWRRPNLHAAVRNRFNAQASLFVPSRQCIPFTCRRPASSNTHRALKQAQTPSISTPSISPPVPQPPQELPSMHYLQLCPISTLLTPHIPIYQPPHPPSPHLSRSRRSRSIRASILAELCHPPSPPPPFFPPAPAPPAAAPPVAAPPAAAGAAPAAGRAGRQSQVQG